MELRTPRIFLSHSSKQKPLVRELGQRFPEYLRTWIDEKEILVGDNVELSLHNAIACESDYLVLLLDAEAASSAWVRRELEWAFAREDELHRSFVLPVFLDDDTWQRDPFDLKRRACLRLSGHDRPAVEDLGRRIVEQIHRLITRDLLKPPVQKRPPLGTVLAETDMRIEAVAHDVRRLVQPFRREHPIGVEQLYEALRLENTEVCSLNETAFRDLLAALFQRGRLAGLICQGDDLYVEEEHYAWKTALYPNEKARIARKAIELVGPGAVILLDAGTTTQAIAAELGRRLKLDHWARIKVITNSPVAVGELMRAAHQRLLEDATPVLQVYAVGGRIRPNTVAIVDDPQMSGADACAGLKQLAKMMGPIDVAFVGTNSISEGIGFTTHARSEADTKRIMLEVAKRKVIVTDSSKLGDPHDHIFATFSADVELILGVCEGYETHMQRHRPWLETSGIRLTYA